MSDLTEFNREELEELVKDYRKEIEERRENYRKLSRIRWRLIEERNKCKRLWETLKAEIKEKTTGLHNDYWDIFIEKMEVMEHKDKIKPKSEEEEEGLICPYCKKINTLPIPYHNGECVCSHCKEVLN